MEHDQNKKTDALLVLKGKTDYPTFAHHITEQKVVAREMSQFSHSGILNQLSQNKSETEKKIDRTIYDTFSTAGKQGTSASYTSAVISVSNPPAVGHISEIVNNINF